MPGWVLAVCTVAFSALIAGTQKSQLSSVISLEKNESFNHEENSPAEVNKQVLNSPIHPGFQVPVRAKGVQTAG